MKYMKYINIYLLYFWDYNTPKKIWVAFLDKLEFIKYKKINKKKILKWKHLGKFLN